MAGPLVFSRRRPGTLETVAIEAPVANVGGTFGAVVAHELGHVLGFGTIWDHYDLLRNPSVPDDPDADTHFSGALTVAAFDAAGGAGYVGGAKVPVEAEGCAGWPTPTGGRRCSGTS